MQSCAVRIWLRIVKDKKSDKTNCNVPVFFDTRNKYRYVLNKQLWWCGCAWDDYLCKRDYTGK